MRRFVFAMTAAAFSLAGCTSDAEEAPSIDTPETTPSPQETQEEPSPSEPADTPSPSREPSLNTEDRPTQDAVGGYGMSLEGVPDCDISTFTMVEAGNGDITWPGPVTDNKGLDYDWQNYFALENSTDTACVIREPITLRFENEEGEIQWPVFDGTVPDESLPWVVPSQFAIRLYYDVDRDSYPCSADDVYVATVLFQTETQGVIAEPFGYGLFVCPYEATGFHSDAHMHLVQ